MIRPVTAKNPPRLTASPSRRSSRANTRNLLPTATTHSSSPPTTFAAGPVAAFSREVTACLAISTISSTTLSSSAVSNETEKVSTMIDGMY